MTVLARSGLDHQIILCGSFGRVYARFHKIKTDEDILFVRQKILFLLSSDSKPAFSVVDKPGMCPVMPTSAAYRCKSQCATDADCEGEHKCCMMGCGRRCVPPNKPGKKQARWCIFQFLSFSVSFAKERNKKLKCRQQGSNPRLDYYSGS